MLVMDMIMVALEDLSDVVHEAQSKTTVIDCVHCGNKGPHDFGLLVVVAADKGGENQPCVRYHCHFSCHDCGRLTDVTTEKEIEVVMQKDTIDGVWQPEEM